MNNENLDLIIEHIESKNLRDLKNAIYNELNEKAYEKFKELIANEMNPNNSWVGELEWENGVPKDDKIEFDFLDRRNDADETECYWLITDTWDYGIHIYISIEIKEVL